MVNVILAMALDGAIGDAGDLLWHLRGDLQRFKALTMGHPVVMGRRTWESLPKGALPGRRNVVVSRNRGYVAPGAEVVGSLSEAMALCGDVPIYIIGGAQIYREALPVADRLELTRVEAEYPDADTRIEDPLAGGGWECVYRSADERDEKIGLVYRFETWEREGCNR